MTYAKLFRLLKKRKINPTDLIEYGLITPSTMTRLRNGQQVSLYTLEILCRFLHCGLSDIVSVTKYKKKKTSRTRRTTK